MIARLIRAGMNAARLNLSHGDVAAHAGRIARIRAAEAANCARAEDRVARRPDLPGQQSACLRGAAGVTSPNPMVKRVTKLK
jgi:hypothetical protein